MKEEHGDSNSISEDDDEYDETSSVDSIETSKTKEVKFLKQHAIAIIIAILATVITFINTTTHEISWYPNKNQQQRRRKLDKNNVTLFTTGYHRTRGINFCITDDMEYDDDETLTQSDKEKGLVTFDFIVPKEYIYIMVKYYEDDEKSDVNMQLYGDKSYECLKNLAESDQSQYNIKGLAKAYVQPDISTFYQLKLPSNHKPSDEIKVATQSFTNFGSKFYNLSPKAVALWWDGGGSNKGRKVGTIKPFECIGTATFPGNSFSFTATYDKLVPYERYVVTADDAVIAYDPISKDNDNTLKINLSPEEKLMYHMSKLNFVFERDYTIKTGRTWLSAFPRPPPLHYMHPAEYFGQLIKIKTDQTHFITLPKKLNRLGMDHDYDNNIIMYPEHRQREKHLELTLNVISCAPRVYEIQHFLSNAEVEHMMQLSTNITFQNSTTSNSGTESDTNVRSSTNAWLHRETSPIIDTIYRRAADILKIPEHLLRHFDDNHHDTSNKKEHHSIAEAIQFAHYSKNQQYTPHHDFHYPSILDKYQPLRYATILFYLNDAEDMNGGETVFPKSVTADKHDGLVVEPKKGNAILFYNMLPDGNVDDLSMHGSKMILEGEKWVGNLWIWDPVIA